MTKLGQELIESANEALAIARGDKAPAKVFAPDEIDVAAIRKRLGLSQGKFAERFRISPAAVRDWEQKRRSPDGAARALLIVIDYAPETVERALRRRKAA